MHRIAFTIFVIAALAALSAAQTPPPPAAVSYTSINELNQILGNLEQASQATQNDLGRLRVDKWKTESSVKRQAESDIESIQRNLHDALPGMLNELRSSPDNLLHTIKV